MGLREFYMCFNVYRILSILLPGVRDTGFNILVYFMDVGYLRKLIIVKLCGTGYLSI